MKEISKEQLEKRIRVFEMKGWSAEILGDTLEEEKLYITTPDGWKLNEEYTNLKDYSKASSQKQKDAIRYMNLSKIHYRRFPEFWLDNIVD
jgi:hypothetical protein